jgi:seryl-tRNA synthetase
VLDLNLIRENREAVEKALLKRMDHVDFSELLAWDQKRREVQTSSENLKARRNKVSAEIPVLQKQKAEVGHLIEEMKHVAAQIKELDEELNLMTAKINDHLCRLPNIPADDVVAGDKENNVVVKSFGQRPAFDFAPKNHVELAELLDIVDYKRGVKLGGAGFWIYKNLGARLEWALLNYFQEEHIKDGYEFILPPHILNYECGFTAGQFPKFEEDIFAMKSDHARGFDFFLLPTAETALVNLHRDEILKEADLPRKYFAYTPCYRKEAGGYRADEKGMIRGHQFNKVEIFQYSLPEKSDAALQEMIRKSERLVEGLGLHFQVSKLAAKDCSASMAKTFDIEVWLPSINGYKEVSSASNAHDYQARRGNMRFKREATGKNELLHTLNASGLATSRLFPAILEHYQQKDGSVVVPEVLRKWVGTDIIKPK